MLRRWSLFGYSLIALAFCLPTVCHAFIVLTEEQALKEVFFSGAEIETETKTLAGDTLKKIKESLGGNLIYHQEGSESADVQSNQNVKLFFAKKDGERKGVAIIDEQPGKWGPVVFIIAMDIKGTVKAVRVMSYQEIRGRPIARLAFMNQYKGKSVNSTLTVGRDIVGISGATISSRSATFAVKKALVLYDELYLKKP
ncbi:MAG: FMN-binding protein [Proteobacteria bacterium]|nr:FMN-binding protein [Pseudomonadota bacterium]